MDTFVINQHCSNDSSQTSTNDVVPISDVKLARP